MKKIILNSLKVIAVALLMSIAYMPLNAGCVVCDGTETNNGWCKGDQIKACVDDGTFWDAKCRIKAKSLNDCPSLGL